MIRNAAFLASILLFILFTACSVLTPKERAAQIPNIPVEKKNCDSPLGVISDGESAQGFLNEFEPAGMSCQAGELTCHDGVWGGPFVHAKCTPGMIVAP